MAPTWFGSLGLRFRLVFECITFSIYNSVVSRPTCMLIGSKLPCSRYILQCLCSILMSEVHHLCMQIGLDDENSYWLVISARLCACARHDRTALRTDGTQAATLISSYFPEAIDVHCNVVDLWASLEARHGATNEARELAWKPLLSRADTQQRRDVHKKYGWWEVQWGSIPTLREFYEWLLSRKKNVLPAAQRVDVAQNWVNAEERFGDIAHEMQARRMLTMLRVESQAEAAVTQNQEKKAADRGGKRKRPEEHEAGAGAPETGTQAPGKGKRSKNDATPAAAQHHNDTEAGKASGQERVEGAAEAGPGDGATGSAKAKQKKKKKAQGGVDGGGGMTGPKDGPAARIFTDKCTVFVQNLPEDVTGDDLKELFQVTFGNMLDFVLRRWRLHFLREFLVNRLCNALYLRAA